MQESMQADVINNVMKRLDANLAKYDERIAESIVQINTDLSKKFVT